MRKKEIVRERERERERESERECVSDMLSLKFREEIEKVIRPCTRVKIRRL